MIARRALLLLALLAAPPALAFHGTGHGGEGAPDPRSAKIHDCKVAISGSITANFKCKAILRQDESGIRLEINPVGLPKDLRSFMGGPFLFKGVIDAKTYATADLLEGRMMVAKKDKGTYVLEAAVPAVQGNPAVPGRGGVEWKVASVKDAKYKTKQIKGTFTATLVPFDPKTTGELKVSIKI